MPEFILIQLWLQSLQYVGHSDSLNCGYLTARKSVQKLDLIEQKRKSCLCPFQSFNNIMLFIKTIDKINNTLQALPHDTYVDLKGNILGFK
jgi:hypothetical protein